MTFETLPIHYQLAQKLSSVPWSGNRLPGGEFDSLTAAIEAGWRHQSSLTSTAGYAGGGETSTAADTTPTVEISPKAAHSGDGGLRVVLPPGASRAGNLVQIASPHVQLPANAMIRVDGWAKVTGNPDRDQIWLQCGDSFGGDDLAIAVTPGPDWQRVTFYRAAAGDHVSVRFGFYGSGEIWLDDVRLTVIEVPQ